MPSFRERIDGDNLLTDSGIVSHGYAPHLRDYDVVIDVPAALPPGVPVVTVETNTFILRLVCHDLRIQQLAVGDPLTQTLQPLDSE